MSAPEFFPLDEHGLSTVLPIRSALCCSSAASVSSTRKLNSYAVLVFGKTSITSTESSACCFDGALDVGRARIRDPGDIAPGRRIGDFQRHPIRRRTELTVNQHGVISFDQGVNRVGHRRCHTYVISISSTFVVGLSHFAKAAGSVRMRTRETGNKRSNAWLDHGPDLTTGGNTLKRLGHATKSVGVTEELCEVKGISLPLQKL